MPLIPILNIEQFENEESLNDFYSNRLGPHLSKNKDLVYVPHRHDFFLCVVFSKGTGSHEIDFVTYPVLSGSVFFLKPGQTHSWKFEHDPEGYIFFHTQDFFEFTFSNAKLIQFPFYYSYENPPNLQLSTDTLEPVISRFKEINDEYHKMDPFKQQKLSSLIHLTYIDLTRLYATSESQGTEVSSTYLNALRHLEILVQEFYRTEKSPAFYAEKLNITTKHLNRITKSTLSKTSSELITERVLLEAKRLLVHSESPLAAIAEILGYDDYAYFSRIFKLKTKSTPSEFRNHYRSMRSF
ncbi:helix-turn-helix domain-containing protein [Maribacter sp. ANRC-HE7]|uniref:Helix-turn-helix domain-containing protein n=1 Tax=Maribacter aquimaris TaxID=2737171 RepID=A0ABR7UW61_9FLAO|nr:helix-turn-helix transcriptional regulator [Maribacter aquimaris]MBD0776362.1 helix-turn-helix domain-containing protein [Maribacter aquimaris]